MSWWDLSHAWWKRLCTLPYSPADYKVKRVKGRNCFEVLSVGGWMNAEGPWLDFFVPWLGTSAGLL